MADWVTIPPMATIARRPFCEILKESFSLTFPEILEYFINNLTQNTYLQFLQLHIFLLGSIFGIQIERIKTKVPRLTIKLVHVGQGRERRGLQEGDPSENLNHGFRKSIVRLNDLGDGFKGELLSRNSNEFGDYETSDSEHGGAAVLQFGFAVPGKPLGGFLCDFFEKSEAKRVIIVRYKKRLSCAVCQENRSLPKQCPTGQSSSIQCLQ